MQIGEAIKKLREHKELSGIELASRIGKQPSQIYRYERGERNPAIAQCYEIADALEVNPLLLVALQSEDKKVVADARKELQEILDN